LPLFFTLQQAATLAGPGYADVHGAIPVLCHDLRASYPGVWVVPVCEGYARLRERNCDAAAAAFDEALRITQEADDRVGTARARHGISLLKDARGGSGCA
jgi:hypothetical protein